MNEGTKVGINVLEFFAVCHFVIVWRQSLRGKVVKCNCDNSVAVALLSTMRASNKFPVAESFVLSITFNLFLVISLAFLTLTLIICLVMFYCRKCG